MTEHLQSSRVTKRRQIDNEFVYKEWYSCGDIAAAAAVRWMDLTVSIYKYSGWIHTFERKIKTHCFKRGCRIIQNYDFSNCKVNEFLCCFPWKLQFLYIYSLFLSQSVKCQSVYFSVFSEMWSLIP